MTSQELGSHFENLTKDFFDELFKEIGLQVNNGWVQGAGTQNGFDVGFQIAVLNDHFFSRSVYIECKNYAKTKLEQSQLHTKLLQFSRSDFYKENSIFIFLSPKADLKKSPKDCNAKELEDYFQSSFKFRTIILTPNSRVDEILSLNEVIYKEVYENTIFKSPNAKEREQILNYFSILFRSKGEVPDFTKKSQKTTYLEEANGVKNENFYIQRTVNSASKSFHFNEFTLLEVLKGFDCILLLGEPGAGKTTELIKTANYFSERISTLEITPIFISLSNVKLFSKIEEILPKDWKKSKKIILLLDAWDEFDFKKKFADEVKLLKEDREISIKIIVSCRSYAYNNELEVLEPEKFYLNGFDFYQSYDFLNRKFSIGKEVFDRIDKNKFKDVLADPFMLDRLGLYYNKNSRVPENILEIYKEIKSELNDQEIDLYTLFALTLELTRKVSFTIDELKVLFGVNFKKFQKLNFLEKSFDKKSFKFKHKNYQEFFAASALSMLEVKEIKHFVLIPNTNTMHPLLFNTITFLINILEIDKFNEFIDWIGVNEPEFLFKAERSRIEQIRVKVFQDYFIKECLEKSLWIDSGKTLTMREIGEFADSSENLKFLLGHIKDNISHIRIVVSALYLISYFTLSENEKEDIKMVFIGYLEDQTVLKTIKSGIINCITGIRVVKDDQKFLDHVFQVFKNETNREINSALLMMIRDYEDPDRLFDFIKAEFLLNHKIVKREEEDKSVGGNNWLLEELIMRFNDSSHFIDLVAHYFIKQKMIRASGTFASGAVERTVYFGKQDNAFIIRFLTAVGGNLNYFRRDTLISEMIRNSSNILGAAEFLLKNNAFQIVSYHLGAIADKNVLELIKNYYKEGKINAEEVHAFRSNLYYNNADKKLSRDFEEMMSTEGFVPSANLNSERENDERMKMRLVRMQRNFDIFFDKEAFMKEIELIFNKSGSKEINQEVISKLEEKWYGYYGNYGMPVDGCLKFLQDVLWDSGGPVNLESVKEIVDNDFALFYCISLLISDEKSHEKFIVSENQKQLIVAWCHKKTLEINFNEIINVKNQTEFTYGSDYFKLETVLRFHKNLDFELAKDFLLQAVEFYEVDNFASNIDLEYLSNKINDQHLFNNRIIYNLKYSNMFSSILERHIVYALNHKLLDAMPAVKGYLSKQKLGYNFDPKLEQYFDLTGDVDFIKDCAEDVSTTKCWSAVKIMLKNSIENEFCVRKAIELLDSEKNRSFFSFDALLVLFQSNSPEAIVYYYNMLKNGENNLSFHGAYRIVNYDVLEKLFFFIFGENYQANMYNYSIDFLKSYISNLSETDIDFFNTQRKLNEIKSRVEPNGRDAEIFYINYLLDLSKNAHYNFKSKPMEFSKAIQKVEEIID
ncbi:NACHT domain-containing protein [Flavobacterium sp. F52]|uniref:NACHT domain-containing protein n=1 Tax=Flavobacterium sp. F52 TaxID=1202532 RepID=UPI000272DBF4|nr:hypothetical protein [Flavobacterium sp. F52]EJG03206.1 hypothetical protein FF52_03400 [Flavobacterium sp. F52]